MPPEIVQRVVAAVERDLRDGIGRRGQGHLRDLEYDAGWRLVVDDPRDARAP
jgi:hypothetical protein